MHAVLTVVGSGRQPQVSAPRVDLVDGGRRIPLDSLKRAVSVRRQAHSGTTACFLGLILAAAMFLPAPASHARHSSSVTQNA